MATNLRLSDAAAEALREAARQSGRSQQELLRDAVDEYLQRHAAPTARDRAIASGLVRPPTPFVDEAPSVVLPDGVGSIELLDRDER